MASRRRPIRAFPLPRPLHAVLLSAGILFMLLAGAAMNGTASADPQIDDVVDDLQYDDDYWEDEYWGEDAAEYLEERLDRDEAAEEYIEERMEREELAEEYIEERLQEADEQLEAPSIYYDGTDEEHGIGEGDYGTPYSPLHPHAPVFSGEDPGLGGPWRYYTRDWYDDRSDFDIWYDDDWYDNWYEMRQEDER